jgi:hypothetical protein
MLHTIYEADPGKNKPVPCNTFPDQCNYVFVFYQGTNGSPSGKKQTCPAGFVNVPP